MSNNCENSMSRLEQHTISKSLLAAILLAVGIILSGCGERGAVVFAPTPLPLDISPAPYTHSSGAFTIDIPRQWAVQSQITPTLASASFTPPGEPHAMIEIAVINLAGDEQMTDLATIITIYQREIRPDLPRYSEQGRKAMGDSSWRIAGIRTPSGGIEQQVNTFIEQTGTFLGIIHITLPETGSTLFNDLEQAINTFKIDPNATLEASGLSTLSFAASSVLEVSGMIDWVTQDGVYFITGEIHNHSAETLNSVPVQVELQAADGSTVVIWPPEPGTTMGYGIPPGGFAPFSLRFGQGQPPATSRIILNLGDETWQQNITAPPIYSDESMTWTEAASVSPEGHFLIDGTLTNVDSAIVRDPIAIVTIFDAQQNVIGARYEQITEGGLLPGESIDFHLRVQEMGGEAKSYFVTIQALPDSYNGQ